MNLRGGKCETLSDCKVGDVGMIFFGGFEAALASLVYSFTTINVPGAIETVVDGINCAGQIVGLIVRIPAGRREK
jgi:hypothetical protein